VNLLFFVIVIAMTPAHTTSHSTLSTPNGVHSQALARLPDRHDDLQRTRHATLQFPPALLQAVPHVLVGVCSCWNASCRTLPARPGFSPHRLGAQLYVSVTNRCNTVPLHVTRGPGFRMPATFSPLPSLFEPTAQVWPSPLLRGCPLMCKSHCRYLW
jgi:hypothetical protein